MTFPGTWGSTDCSTKKGTNGQGERMAYSVGVLISIHGEIFLHSAIPNVRAS